MFYGSLQNRYNCYNNDSIYNDLTRCSEVTSPFRESICHLLCSAQEHKRWTLEIGRGSQCLLICLIPLTTATLPALKF